MKPWEKNIRKVEPYVPGEQPQSSNVIKLNTNENPYLPSPRVLKKMEELDQSKFALYPDPDCEVLVNGLAKYYGLDKNQIFVGVGSDDVLAMSFLTFFNSDQPVLFPDITYSFYDVWAKLYRIPFEQIPLDENLRIKKEDYDKANGGVVIANPNAPTSICEGLDFIEDIVKKNQKSIVIVDEAYIDFGGESALKLLNKYENLLIVRTYSKSRAMAGMRIGFAIGNPDLIQALKNVKESYNSYTMNFPSLILGAESLEDDEYFRDKLQKVIATRERMKEELRKLGFVFPDSKTNFLFISHSEVPASYIFENLREMGIFVRYFNKPRINNYLRVSIGTEEQMDEFLETVKKTLKKYKKVVDNTKSL